MRFFLSLSHGIRTSFCLFIQLLSAIIRNLYWEAAVDWSWGSSDRDLKANRPVWFREGPSILFRNMFSITWWKEPGHWWDLQRPRRDTAVSSKVLTCCPPRSVCGEHGTKSVLVNFWASADTEKRCYEVPPAWRSPPGEPKLQWGGGGRGEPLQDGYRGAGGNNKGVQNSSWKLRVGAWDLERAASAEPWDPERRNFAWALPPEKAACEDSLGFISTPVFHFGETSWERWSDLLPITPRVWVTRAATSQPLLTACSESVSFFLNHFFCILLWFEMRMCSVRASKTPTSAWKGLRAYLRIAGLILGFAGKD